MTTIMGVGTRRWRRFTLSSALATARCIGSSASAAAFTVHSSFAELIPRYDAFILDQFGVMHNGVESLPGAVECVAELKRQNKRFVILSNTSAPNRVALKRLSKYGFQPEDFVGAVTSGEEAAKHVRTTYGSGGATSNALVFTWDSTDPKNPRLSSLPEDYLQECGNVQVATSAGSADFVLLHGSEVWYKGRQDQVPLAFIDTGTYGTVDPILTECAKRNLPMVCANADFVVQTPTGGVAHMPGKIAQRYQTLGGQTTVFGKPQREHFLACVRALKFDHDVSRVAHVGDSLHHDVAGAAGAGIASIFVASGIHARDLDISYGQVPSRQRLEQLFYPSDENQVVPTHVVSSFAL